MKLQSRPLKAIIAAASLSLPFAGIAQNQGPALKPGVYVQQKQPCKGAPNAAIMVWDGTAFSGAHSSHCASHILRRDPAHFQVSTVCSALGDGSPIAVGSNAPDSFLLTRLSYTQYIVLRDQQGQRSFRWCSVQPVD